MLPPLPLQQQQRHAMHTVPPLHPRLRLHAVGAEAAAYTTASVPRRQHPPTPPLPLPRLHHPAAALLRLRRVLRLVGLRGALPAAMTCTVWLSLLRPQYSQEGAVEEVGLLVPSMATESVSLRLTLMTARRVSVHVLD